MKRILDLFCGTKSASKAFELAGYEAVSLDFNKKFNATHTEDILTWDYKVYPPNYFNVIWASPDCTTWSIATSGKYRLKSDIYGVNNQYQEIATNANNMILRLIEILKYFKPSYWFIENPKALLQHFPPLKQFISESNANMNLVFYANYNNWLLPKPTNIWSNLPLWENETKPVMPVDCYYRKNNKIYYKGYGNTQRKAEERSKIPPDLIKRLIQLIPNGDAVPL
jgi:hypothetical protein